MTKRNEENASQTVEKGRSRRKNQNIKLGNVY